ncbi:MAG: serine/threonine protein kinase, partial [Ktedonobacteraceae bacterium]
MLQVELPQIGSYTPVRPLGEGSTTFTYLYRYEQRKRYVVIKLTRTPLITLAEKEAFLARAKLLKKLKHRNMSEIMDYGLLPSGEPADDYGYVVVQYIEGSTIRERFVPGQCYPPDEVRAALFPVADTLQYAHKMFAVHGNLHPGNVLQAGKDVFLTDFSLPTQVWSLPDVQTLLYRAPEHLRGTASAASDQYSLAVMAYEWLCGRRPYAASSPEELLVLQEREPLPAPSSLNPQIKPRIEEILLQALAVNPSERFPYTLTFFDAYLYALMGRPFTITPVPEAAPAPTQPAPRELPASSTRKSSTPKKSSTPPTPSKQPILATSEDLVLARIQPPAGQSLADLARQEVIADRGSEPTTRLAPRTRGAQKRATPATSEQLLPTQQPEQTVPTKAVAAQKPATPVTADQALRTITKQTATGAEPVKLALSPRPSSPSDLQH